MNDVRILGLNMHTVLIEDISMDVPHGVTIIIPADKAAKSKDLWRLISQKMLFRLNPGGPLADYPPATPPQPNQEAERLREENRLLAEQNQMLKQVLDKQGGKLDMILGALETARFAGPSSGPGATVATTKADNGVVDAGVPTYIPSEIKPKNVESHVEVQSETSEGSNIAGAGEALRRLRRGSR
jgi:hypothetical protein